MSDLFKFTNEIVSDINNTSNFINLQNNVWTSPIQKQESQLEKIYEKFYQANFNFSELYYQIQQKNIIDDELEKKLIKAAENGNIGIVITVLKSSVNINYTDQNSDTALMLASKNNHFEIVKILLSYKAKINYKNKFDNTALMMASQQKNYEVMKLLIKKGANVEYLNNSNYESWILNSINNKVVIDIIKILLYKDYKNNLKKMFSNLKLPINLKMNYSGNNQDSNLQKLCCNEIKKISKINVFKYDDLENNFKKFGFFIDELKISKIQKNVMSFS